MAEASLKLGGDWATKEGSLLGFNDQNGNYKPIPFDFTRATTATRVNRDGLIEEVQAGVPRIDFSSGDGSLLLEPQRTNLVPNSEYSGDSSWVKANVSVTDNSITSPEGVNNAFKISENSSGTNLRAIYYVLTSTSAVDYTHSVFLKEGSLRYGGVRAMVDGGTDRFFVNVDLQEGIVTSTNTVGSSVTWTYGVEFISDGWYRVWITGANTSGLVYIAIGLSNSATPSYVSALPNYNGTGSDYIYAYGAQLEAGSYATSYIKTSGSAVTRNADVCNNAQTTFNDSEGVLYAEIELLQDTPSANMYFGISSGALANSIFFRFNTAGDIVAYNAGLGSSNIIALKSASEIDLTSTLKLALKYGATNLNFSVYLNGSKIPEYGSFSATVVSGLNKYDFALYDGTSSPLYGKIKDTRVYNTALTDTELQELTTI